MAHVDAPAGYIARDATLEDAAAISELVNEVNVAEIGTPLTSVEEVRNDLTSPREYREDTVLEAHGGALVGYLTAWGDDGPPFEMTQLAFVRPTLWGRGLSAWLLRHGEGRADAWAHRAEAAPRLVRVARWAPNRAAGDLFRSLGYTYTRTFSTMRIELSGSPRSPEVPAGVDVRAFDVERDARTVHAALREAFADHWGRALDAFDAWSHDHLDRETGFDAGLWFVARVGDEVAGAVCGRPSSSESPDAASVDTLGVRGPWRRRGVARALLLAAFAEFQRRGIRAAELVVDSESPTGATQLYEGVGMRVVRQSEFWEKSLTLA
jgi:mycothiol synthase